MYYLGNLPNPCHPRRCQTPIYVGRKQLPTIPTIIMCGSQGGQSMTHELQISKYVTKIAIKIRYSIPNSSFEYASAMNKSKTINLKSLVTTVQQG